MRLGVVAAVVLALGVHPAIADADWAVKRSGTGALEAQAERALVARPTDARLASRLARLAGKSGAAALRARFEARAASGRFADLAAYATLLAALGADEDAAAAFARAAALRPDPAVLAGRARALAHGDHRAEAIAAYDDAARAAAPRTRRQLLEAEVALLEGPSDLERALTVRRALAALDPRSDEAAGHVADLLARLGRPGEAADLLEARLPKNRAARFDGALRVAELRDAAGDGAGAAALLAEVLRALPRADVERRRLAWTRAVAVARHRDALADLGASLAREAGPVEWDILGQVRDELGDLEGALEAERRAAGPHPSAELGRRIVALLDRLGRDDEAVTVYEDLARRAPTDPSWSLELVERELRRGLRKQAEAHFDAALARFSRSPSATMRLAELASRWGEDARALTAWTRARARAPRDEQAILGLGETQFAAGKRALALRTWRALRDGAPSAVEGRLRLAEVLLDHDLLVEAFAEAQEARARAPKQPSVHRLLAQILERQRQTDAAVREWDVVVELAAGAAEADERREARARVLTLLARTNRGRLDERVRALEERVRRAPEDRETALFLAEAQQRLGDRAGAVATLRAIVDRDDAAATATTAGHAPPDGDDARAEATLALVRLLRATGDNEEAVRRLEALAKDAPARAREAHVQIADVELGRHDETVALAHATLAARLAPGDGQALARIAAIEERAGDEARALETYRRAFEEDGDATAGFALATMLERRGDAAQAATVLHRLLDTATDDEVILEAGRRAIELDEYLGRLPELERAVARGLYAGARAPVLRRVLVELLRRLLPPLYTSGPSDAAASAERTRLAQHGLRPLLEVIGDSDGRPERALVTLLGMLGNKDAAPVLARLAAPATDPSHDDRPGASAAGAHDVQVAAVIALGRLADERGHDVLERLAAAPDGRLRAAAVWALGRVAVPRDVAAFTHALRDGRADVVGLACLGLGRAHDAQALAALTNVAADVTRPSSVRRAAITGLALSADRAAAAPLLVLARSGDDALARAALLALGALREPRARPALLEAALLGGAPTDGDALLALDLWATRAPLPDEATALDDTHVDLDAALAGLEPRPSGAATSDLSRDDARAARVAIADALEHAGERRARALAALDDRADGVGLGPLVPRANQALAPSTISALSELLAATRDDVAKLLEDADPELRAHALSILSKADDARVSSTLVLRAAIGAPAERAVAAAVARRWAERAPRDAQRLAQRLAAKLTETPEWDGRLGLVEVLSATGQPGLAALEHARGDASPLVRAAVAEALSHGAPQGRDAPLPARESPPGP
ncbi:MAG TPA: HEAT repeat domain-containing protein [Polyangia bacterium]|nr:HEAT repeat domain-containing protein [Polyangia bacterium]